MRARPIRIVPVFGLLAVASCGGTPAPAPEVPSESSGARAQAIARLATWPGFELHAAPPPAAGTTRTEVHHGTIHATVDLPAGATVEPTTVEFGLPAVWVRAGTVVVELTYGVPPRFAAKGERPASMGPGRLEADPGNITYSARTDGISRVFGYAPGVHCASRVVSEDTVDVAFSLCRGVRAAPLGELVEPPDGPPYLPPLPAHASVARVGADTVVHAGRFRLQVGPSPCRDRAFYERVAFDSTFETRVVPAGTVLIERVYAQLPPERWAASVTVRVSLAGGCCMGGTVEFREPPTDAAVETLIGLCGLAFGQTPRASVPPP